ncbi:hypothetical protein [Streptomyces sp. R02]|uniref:Uncharacterized protein n=1 Tax=Streptomyces sp. R02 TaxID=3238623 RepID=A0AB39LZ36_9ACTN
MLSDYRPRQPVTVLEEDLVVGIDASQWAVSAAQALIASMTTDLWASTRDRFARLLSGRPDATEDVAEELDESRQQLLDAGATDEAREDASTEWVSRFRRALTRNPALLYELRSLITEHGLEAPASTDGVTQNVSATGGGIVFNQGTGTQTNQVQAK